MTQRYLLRSRYIWIASFLHDFLFLATTQLQMKTFPQKPFYWNLGEHIQHIKWGEREEVGLSIPRRMVDIPIVIKTFKFALPLTCFDYLMMQMRIKITFNVYLFFTQFIQFFPLSWLVSWTKSKKLQKHCFLYWV